MGWPFTRAVSNTSALGKILGDTPLPTFPALVLEALGDLRDPNISVRNVADKLRVDPRLSVAILKMANSAAYGARRVIDDVHHAAVFLGRNGLETLILSVAVRDVLPTPASPVFNNARYWRAAARRAATAQGLAARLHPRTRGLSFTAALLQDMAVPLLVERQHDRYAPVLGEWQKAESSLASIETASFGWDHTQIAGWLCEQWGLPESLKSAIAGHHNHSFDNPEIPPAVALVGHLSERLQHPEIEPIVEMARSQFSLEPDTTRDIIQSAFEQADGLALLLAA